MGTNQHMKDTFNTVTVKLVLILTFRIRHWLWIMRQSHRHDSNSMDAYANDNATRIFDNSAPNCESGSSKCGDAGASGGACATQDQGTGGMVVAHPQWPAC